VAGQGTLRFDPQQVESPAFVCDLGLLRQNLELLRSVQERAGCKILLALKGFAMWSTFPIVREYLSGAAASGPHEARLAREELNKEVHVYAPAFSDADVRACLAWANHLVFNSPSQWQRFRPLVAGSAVRCGLRVNPEHRETEVELYDPCAPRSRLGTTLGALTGSDLEGITGLHFHTLCEKDSDALERTLAVVEAKFGHVLSKLEWVNFGGGHLITRPGYDVERLIRVVKGFRERTGLEVYLEPGEAIGFRTGVLVGTVLDIVDNGGPVAVLDVSATAHMPDVLEMPYRPAIVGAGEPGEFAHTYRLGGLTCLAGDVIGDWSFPKPLRVGDRVVFEDMIHYTMVKTTMFNGVQHPSIATFEPVSGVIQVVRRFGYEDFKARLS
jgi:carboxynorspermidine decarboxylase